jgi:hypothetical protein
MKIGIIVIKDAKGNYINIHASGIADDARKLFKHLKAQARLCRSKKQDEIITVDGKEIEICGMWLFINSDDRYTSIKGHLTRDEEKQQRIFEHQQKVEHEKLMQEAQQRKENEKKQKESAKLEAIEIENDRVKKLKEFKIEKEELLLKAQKIQQAKKPKTIKKEE